VDLVDRLCGLVVTVPGYGTEMYCVSCEVRTEFICYVEESRPPLWSKSSWLQNEKPKSDSSGMAQKQLYSNLQTRPLVREGATKLQTRHCLKELSKRKKNWSQVPDGRLTPGQTGRLTVGRKLTN
jgi:hypothetical protein